MIIGITGTNGAGKGVVVDYLVQQKGFSHFSSSGRISEELTRRGRELSRTNMRAVGNEFREKFGSSYLVDVALQEAREQKLINIVIESIRSIGEAHALKKAGGKLLVIDANRALRYERIFARRSGKDLIDFDTFVEQEEREWYGKEGEHDMNIRSVIEMADHTIVNDVSVEDLYAHVDAFLNTFSKQ
jgi:dephospho-CoA kinase